MDKKNLEYVYCKTTEENYKKLVEVVFEKSTFLVGWEALGTKWEYIAISDECRIMCGVTKEYIEEHPEYKEIHLVDGEFEFVKEESPKIVLGSETHFCPNCNKQVITKQHECTNKDDPSQSKADADCQFAKYGFEVPEFEAELYYKDKFGCIYGLVDGFSFMFDTDGTAYNSDKTDEELNLQYNLTPIKKPWYEDESNFPCVVKNTHTGIFQIMRKSNNSIQCIHTLQTYNPKNYRLATKEEVLSLFKEEK